MARVPSDTCGNIGGVMDPRLHGYTKQQLEEAHYFVMMEGGLQGAPQHIIEEEMFRYLQRSFRYRDVPLHPPNVKTLKPSKVVTSGHEDNKLLLLL